MSQTIAVFTSSRADVGPLGSIVRAVALHPDLTPIVIATGSHSTSTTDMVLESLEAPTDLTVEVVQMNATSDDIADLADAMATITEGLASMFSRVGDIDAIVLLGDRWELLPVASVAMLFGIPVAHVHGGEITLGAFDERIRHAITKLADLHLCSTEDHARRIRQLGEEEWRVEVVGAPGLDRLKRETSDLPTFAQKLERPIQRPFGLVTYHPPTAQPDHVRRSARDLLEACAARLGTILITHPGLDPGRSEILEEIDSFVARDPSAIAVPNLGTNYVDAMSLADVMVGNSSSGIIEAASFKVPVVDVGSRQTGRTRGRNVLHADDDRTSIEEALERALDPAFRASLSDLVNPYGDGTAGQRIADILARTNLKSRRAKTFVDWSRDG